MKVYMIPKPYSVEEKAGEFLLPWDGVITVDNSCGESYFYACLLKQEIRESVGFSLDILAQETEHTAVFMGLDPEGEWENGKEEYLLEVTQRKIRLTAPCGAGLIMGMQTLRQIIRQAKAVIPCMRVRDYPQIANRGYYLDVTRGRIPKLTELKKLVEKLSFYKINQLQIYIEHSFLFPGLSEVWRDDTPLTAEDILELERHCRKHHIDLVPSLSSFGHLYKVLRTRTFRHLGEFPQMADEPFGFVDRMLHHTLNVSKEEALTFAKEMIDRYMTLFSSRYFNLCADETFDLGKGESKELAGEKGTRRLYLDFVRELCNHVVSRGKIPMFWGDIIRSFPEAVSELPKETICLNWGYDANEGPEATQAFARSGIRQYTCPGVNGWNHLIPRIRDSYENIRRMCSYALTYGAEGVLNTDWGDYGHINHPDFSTAGMIYGAAFSWRGETLPFEEISRQISLLEYGDRSESLITLLAGLPEQGFGWRQAVNYLEKGNADKEMFEKTAECLEEIRRAAGELCRILPEIDSSGRERAAAYLIGMRGIELLALTGSFVGEKEFGTKGAQEVSKGVLAQRLEEWFYDYKALWRGTSRESELYRIQNVVYWYADLLRGADGSQINNNKQIGKNL